MVIIQKTFFQSKSILYLVSTPIGNLSDISLRALEILKTVDYILTEDTRRARKLTSYYKIQKPLISFHKYNEQKRLSKVLNLLKEKNNLALISDSGTPLICDPGLGLIKEVKKSGFFVTAVPGSSAFLTAFTLSSLEFPFCFLGFFPKKTKAREELLLKYYAFDGTLIFYESAKRIHSTLLFIQKHYQKRKIVLARELTKKFETIISGDIDMVLQQHLSLKGEYVLLIEKNFHPHLIEKKIDFKQYINLFLKQGFSEKEALKQVAKICRLSKKEIYKKIKIIE
ncbi:16S rRNA (cytidine(1402)-2'-O)-methyltransferase [Candidatus Phytoplasma pini]|uniref:Ribosomal RNA small subunit methyltransferase I n=1 Tax=Candidatus Phytoplasma pini TaxID=267362 RepID=A0A559KJL9_9MOLU|nr:16S rRNA (cytidine(1402)-2'-O)-methyltransferase [Candidatus Phytoplasma pini]TVY12326.1 tetrapyrrole (Corrin/Porphyrin) methylase [Candidatus Phytoplasma pini]